MKTIIFDVDWVITDTLEWKDKVINEVLKEYNLFHLEWVDSILKKMLHRKVMLEEINELHPFDITSVFNVLNNRLVELLKNTVFINSTIEFILKNKNKYLYFINTSMPRKSLEVVLKWSNIEYLFEECFCWEDWTKLEKTDKIIQKYWLIPEEILFIDDTLFHIESVKKSWVKTMHFKDDNIDINKKITTLE